LTLGANGTALGATVKRVASGVGGIVVFGLVMYFVAGRHFGFTEGILSVVFGGGAGLALVNKQKARRLEATGVVALARIIDNASTRAFANYRQVWKLTLHIEGPGFAAFDTGESVRVAPVRVPLIASRKLAVLVDPATKDLPTRLGAKRIRQWSRPIDGDRQRRPANLQPRRKDRLGAGVSADPFGQRHPAEVSGRDVGASEDQLNAIARRAATSPQSIPAAAKTSPPGTDGASLTQPPTRSPAERLQQLETVRAMGTITETEYIAKRQQIIAEL
jgi:hypothetical protein